MNCDAENLKFTVVETDYDKNKAMNTYKNYPKKNQAYDEVAANSFDVSGCEQKLVYVFIPQRGWILNSTTK